FAVGRARRKTRAQTLPPVNSLAAAARRQRPKHAARSTGPASRTDPGKSLPTQTSLTVVTGWLSRHRLAGRNELARQKRPGGAHRARSSPFVRASGQAPASAPPAPTPLWAPRVIPEPDWFDVARRSSLDEPPVGSRTPGGRPWEPASPTRATAATQAGANRAAGATQAGQTRAGANPSGGPTPPTPRTHPRDAEHAAALAAAGTAAEATQPGTGWLDAAAAGQPTTTASHESGQAWSSNEPRVSPKPPMHPLRRVVEPGAGQRTHPRRMASEPAAAKKPPTPPPAPKPKKVAPARPGVTANPTSSKRRIIGWSLLAAGVLVLVASAWVGWRTYQAYTHLQTASADVSQLQDEVKDITTVDPNATAQTVAGLQAEAAAARSAVDDPIYGVAAGLPFVGPNLGAIRDVTVTVDSLAMNVMPSLVDIANTLQPGELAPKDGAIDLAPIERISPLLQSADVEVNQARDRLASIDRTQLLQPVGDAVQTLSAKLGAASAVTGPGARTARLLPPMLGSEGPRTYLVVFQNPSELRATGGIFGSYAVVKADQGKVTILDQGAASRTLGFFDPAAGELSSDQQTLYSQLMAQYPQDVNFTPDYPTAAALFADMYRIRTGGVVDGVLAIDPVALSYMLVGTPGIDVGEGFTITSDNLVSTLLSTAYERFDERSQADRDTFLDNATSQVFATVMSGKGDPRSIIDGLRKAADERRVLVYSANAAEQADIEQTGLAGSLDAGVTPPTIGVFMNDGTAAKLGYYLHNEVHVTEGACRADGRRELQVKVDMRFDAPSSGLPSYVSGTSSPDQPYVLRTNVLAFAPVGGSVEGAEQDGNGIGIGRGEDHSRDVGTATVALSPGSSTELVFTIVGPPGTTGTPADVPPALVVTPGVNPTATSVEGYRDCNGGTS
ncbi:MAG TPA: DUF4012 domain-containing protein, partial [Nakamurella sp.]